MSKFLNNSFSHKFMILERLSPTSGWFYETENTLYKGTTKYQQIQLVETREFGRTLLLDGATQVMEKYEFQYHEPMAHIPLLSHPNPEQVLIIGGGDGGVLREVIKHPSVQRIDLVELDEDVINFSKTFLQFCSQGSFDDPRVHVHIQDGRSFVESKNGFYDAIIMDMTDPRGPSLKLYSQEFFQAVKNILKKGPSFFMMHSESPDCRPLAFARIHRTLKSVFPRVDVATTNIRMYGGLWSFAFARLEPGAKNHQNLSSEEIQKRISQRKLHGLRVVTAQTWPAFFIPYPYIQDILGQKGDICTDDHPDFPDSFDYHI